MKIATKSLSPIKLPTKQSKKKRFCLHPGCKSASSAGGYCRKHYITNWKHIKFNRQVKAERRLNTYVNRLVKKYPNDYLEKIKEGLEDEDKFRESIHELDVGSETSYRESEDEYVEKLARNLKIGKE